MDHRELLSMLDRVEKRGVVACWLLVGSWLVFVAALRWGPPAGDPVLWRDVGLYNLPFLLAGWVLWNRSLRGESDDGAWRVLAVAFVVLAAGSFYDTAFNQEGQYPSPADGFYLAFYLLAYVAVVGLVRARTPRFRTSSWLDGVVAGLGAAALVVAFALGRVLADTSGILSVVATNLAYPTADLVLIVLLVAAGTATRTRDWSFWLLVAAFVVFCVGDVVYLYQVSTDTYVGGGPVDASWPLAAVLIGIAAARRGGIDRRQRESRSHSLVPLAFTLSMLGLLVYGQSHRLPVVAVVLAVAALGVAGIRAGLAFREATAVAESRHEARTDTLTGLANRRGFIERVDADLAANAQTPFCVLMIDLDGFKEVNDSLGHSVGDELLHHVAERFRGRLDADSLLARLGGDEFGVVIPSADGTDAAQHLLDTLRNPFALDGVEVRVGASIGIARFPENATTASDLLRMADVAMYQAKRARTGLKTYQPGDDPHSRDRLALVNELHDAIDNRDLELHYQPVMNVADGAISGLEALVRWPHPTHGLMMPDSFIGIAEESGLIARLTRAVLDIGIADLSRFHADGYDVRLSINISGLDIVDETLPDYVASTLNAYQVDPSYLTLEITESVLASDPDRAERTVLQLQRVGVRVSIDDFGIGYSSMSQLLDLPFDELKVDRSFIATGGRNGKAQAILNATVELGRALGVSVVAEGVEDCESMTLVTESHADHAQGFLISRPLPEEHVRRYLDAINRPTNTHHRKDAHPTPLGK